MNNVAIKKQISQTDLKYEKGPFDIIGDIHGCFDELYELLEKLGYQVQNDTQYIVTHPEGRKVIFVGDLVDRGPKSHEVLRIVMDMVESGIGFCVVGNHDDKLKRKLQGNYVKIAPGLARTLDQLAPETQEFKDKVVNFLSDLVSHYIFDDEKLVVAHAGIKLEFIGVESRRVRNFCMYGETTGKTDELGFPERYLWANDYHGSALIVYGHTPISVLEWINNTINIDTGCVFGGKLTALRYPERELVTVQAAKVYMEHSCS
jgi:protein phosphatase